MYKMYEYIRVNMYAVQTETTTAGQIPPSAGNIVIKNLGFTTSKHLSAKISFR